MPPRYSVITIVTQLPVTGRGVAGPSRQTDRPPQREGKVAVIPITGVLAEGSSFFNDTSTIQVRQNVRKAAADAAFAGAQSHEHNAFKIELGKRTLMRALQQAAAMEV